MKGHVTWFVREFPQMFALDFTISRGWGNGYVSVPKGHPWHGKSYDDLMYDYDIDIHGGLTFAQTSPNWSEEHGFNEEDWVIGFDTAHWGDSISIWPQESVEDETIKLYEMAVSVSDGPGL